MATSLKNIPFVNPVPQMTEDGALIIEDSMHSYCAYMKYDSSMASIQLYTCSDGNMTYVPVEMARYATCGFGDPQMGTYVDACIYIDASMRYIEFCNGADSVPVYCACYASCADSAYGIGVSFESYGCWHYGALTPCIDCCGNILYFCMYDVACSQEMWINILPCGVGVWNSCDSSMHMIGPCMCACEYGGWCYWDGSWYDYTCGNQIYASVCYACYACYAYAACGIEVYYNDWSCHACIAPCIAGSSGCYYITEFYGYDEYWNQITFPIGNACYACYACYADQACYACYACYADVVSWWDADEQRSYTAQPITYDELTSNPSNYKILAAPIN